MTLLGPFGDYAYACRNIPSLPACNLFFRQLLLHPNGIDVPATALLGLPPVTAANYNSTLSSAGMGINPACSILRMAANGGAAESLGNVANMVLCGISVIVAIALAVSCRRRAAAVGRIEMSTFFLFYGIVQALQFLDTGSIFQQGELAITVITAVHLGFVVGLFFILLWCSFLSLQVVEDGTLPSLLPMFVIGFILTGGSFYIFLDIGLTITNYFISNDPAKLHSAWLFVLTIIWPAVAVGLYFLIQLGVVVRVLREKKPALLFLGSIVLFILSQAVYYALSYKMCSGTNHKIDGSFLATLLETSAVVTLFFAWRSITESSWDGEVSMY